MDLNPKQVRFCEEYTVDFNGKQAAIRAGYSKKCAEVQGARMLRNVKVLAKISELQKGMTKRAELSADLIINELKALGFWNIKDFISEGNTILDFSKADRDLLKPIVGLKVTETFLPGNIREVKTEIKLADKRAALVDLGRHLGVFEKDNKQKQAESQPLSDAQVDRMISELRKK